MFGLCRLFPVWPSDADGGVGDLGRWGEVAGTFVAGLGFIWLRHRSGSLLAPILAHAGTNSIPFAVARVVAR